MIRLICDTYRFYRFTKLITEHAELINSQAKAYCVACDMIRTCKTAPLQRLLFRHLHNTMVNTMTKQSLAHPKG